MATTESNFFEIQRRGYQWNKNSTLDDGLSSMLWDSDPNDAVSGHSAGETKLVAMPIGSTFMESAGLLWLKTTMPNTWINLGSGGSTSTGDVTIADWETSTGYVINGVVVHPTTKEIYRATANFTSSASIDTDILDLNLELIGESTLTEMEVDSIAKNIYVTSTGNDTGLGTLVSPYYSIHRALQDVKDYIMNVEVAILVGDGVYDYSALGDIVINKKVIKGASYSGRLRIRPQSTMANAFTVLDSGTFDSQTDDETNVHICTGKAWTVDAYTGKFIRIISMNSGSLPSNGDGINYTGRIIPIVRNGADWIETGFIYNSGLIQNIGQFEIVEHKVVFNLGANGFYITEDVFGVYVFNMIKVETTGMIQIEQNATEFGTDTSFQGITYNSAYLGNFVSTSQIVLGQCYVQATSTMNIGISDGCVFNTKQNVTYGRINAYDYARNAVFINTSAGRNGSLLYVVGMPREMMLVWNVKFINADIAVHCGWDMSLTATVHLDNINWFVEMTNGFNVSFFDRSEGSFRMKNEPIEGRLTLDDGVTAATTFHDLNKNFNVEMLSKSPKLVDIASQLKNDSNISGNTIKDALNRVQGITLPSSAFNGLTTITLSPDEPTTKVIGDIWLDTSLNNPTLFTTGPQTLNETHRYIVCSTSTGFTVNLPIASDDFVGKAYAIKNIGTGSITLTGDATIDGSGSASIIQWQCLIVKLYKTEVSTYMWIII